MPDSKTIYIIDDDPEDRMLLRLAIEDVTKNVKVVELEDGLELIRLIQQKKVLRINLILLDMNMPKSNGLETIRLLRAHSKHAGIPTVMLSTSSNPVHIAWAYDAGVDHFFTKPTTYEDLEIIVKQIATEYLA
ncbi:Response regulator rcp1 [Dyadobacter sp. CECT 9275]|uniref:Response regulator rcp1 n=1 Tax=Dyadobacter helix TaxID=2822344 RepID=A0A916N5U2_9BACT|nr:response regulator [Dyadobacter sp. CECT 9275]CAG4999913.1 Response regulator rcp1 [Dyadobacter sp. CECT 9275]